MLLIKSGSDTQFSWSGRPQRNQCGGLQDADGVSITEEGNLERCSAAETRRHKWKARYINRVSDCKGAGKRTEATEESHFLKGLFNVRTDG